LTTNFKPIVKICIHKTSCKNLTFKIKHGALIKIIAY
jgi:hypothetical protein